MFLPLISLDEVINLGIIKEKYYIFIAQERNIKERSYIIIDWWSRQQAVYNSNIFIKGKVSYSYSKKPLRFSSSR